MGFLALHLTQYPSKTKSVTASGFMRRTDGEGYRQNSGNVQLQKGKRP